MQLLFTQQRSQYCLNIFYTAYKTVFVITASPPITQYKCVARWAILRSQVSLFFSKMRLCVPKNLNPDVMVMKSAKDRA